MNQQNKPVKILSKGWDRINAFPVTVTSQNPLTLSVPEFIAPYVGQGIPISKHIEELIQVPEVDNGDFLHEYRVKSLPQEYNYKSQNLARIYSNKIVKELDEGRLGKPKASAVDQYLADFCDREGIGYPCLEYCVLTIKYFQCLLPQVPLVSKEKKQHIADLGNNLRDESFDRDGFFRNPSYLDKADRSLERVLRRFSFIPELVYHIRAVKCLIKDSGEAQRFNELCIRADLTHQKQWGRSKARKSLRQCIFCYRFFEGVGLVPRSCNSPQCKKANRDWKNRLDREGTTPDAFGFFQRADE